MTTLYRPVLIESAEQAEALPVGTVLNRGWPYQPTLVTQYDGRRHYGAPGTRGKAEDAVGWTAHVPIEAEEERQAIAECEIGVPGTERIVHERRLVTPWEESR